MAGFFELGVEILPTLASGLLVTFQLWIVTLVSGGLLGILIALARVYGIKPIYYFATLYVEFIRGTPLLVQVFLVYYGLGDVGIYLPPFLAASLAFTINTAAYQGEYLRGAIQSIRGGQIEAAKSIGMSKPQFIRYLVLPQSVRLVIPPWSNEAIVMLKFTSLAFMITVPELMAQARMIATNNFRYLEVFGIVAVIYLIVVLIFTQLLDIMEKKIKIPGLGEERTP